jgi:hypothetical protein
LSFCETIHYPPLHVHAHLELEEEPLEVQDLVQLMRVLHQGQPPQMKQDEGITLKQHT